MTNGGRAVYWFKVTLGLAMAGWLVGWLVLPGFIPAPAPPPLADRIPIRMANGESGTIPASSLDEARRQGAKVISSQEFEEEDSRIRSKRRQDEVMSWAAMCAAGLGAIPAACMAWFFFLTLLGQTSAAIRGKDD